MRFMVIVKADKNSEAGALPDEKLLAEMGKYNEELAKAGVLLAGEGLHPSSKGARASDFPGRSEPSSTALSRGPRIWSRGSGYSR